MMHYFTLNRERLPLFPGARVLAPPGVLFVACLVPGVVVAETQSTARAMNVESISELNAQAIDEWPTPRPIATELPGGVAERVYSQYVNPDVALRSYAAVDVGGCSGIMIGPNIMMTAGHCGQGNRNAVFRLYTAAGTQITESFSCEYLIHTFADTDLNLYWCEPNIQGKNPGDKYGYLDFDLVIDPVTGFDYTASRNLLTYGTNTYSLWTNPITDLGPGNHLLYSEGEIDNLDYTSWYTPNIYTGADYLCGNSACVGGQNPGVNCDGGACGQTCVGGTCQARQSRAIAVHTDLWSNPGASGSSQIRESTHRILIGPLSVGPSDNRGRSSLGIADLLYWGITDANATSTNCMSCVTEQINQTLLSSLSLATPSNYYGWVDADLDGLFDVPHDLEQTLGENQREWYWLGFESNRRNQLWTEHAPSTVLFDISDPVTGVATLSTVGQSGSGYVPVVSHSLLNLQADQFYRVSFAAWLTQSSQSIPLRVCLEGPETHCADSNLPLWVESPHVLRLWASSGATLRMYLKKGTELDLAAVSLVPETEIMNFDMHDKRYMWRNHNTGGRGLIWPNGRNSNTQADWAGAVSRDTSEPVDDDWSLRNRQLAIDGGADYRICFEHRNSPTDPLTGNIQGRIRMLNELGEISGSNILFSPSTSWQQTCTPWFYVPTDDNNLQFGVRAWETGATGHYLVDNVQIQRQAPSSVYVNGSSLAFREEGTVTYPYSMVEEGAVAVSDGGDVLIAQGSYPEQPILQKPAVLKSTGGSVVIGE